MRFVVHCMHPGRINPSVIEVEQCAYGDCVVESFICPTMLVQRFDVGALDVRRFMVYLFHEA